MPSSKARRTQPFLAFFRTRLTPFTFPVAIAALAPLVVLPQGYALPAGPQVVAGDVTIGRSGNTLNIAQGSQHAVVNWQGFDIAQNELVRLRQTSNAAMLARVTGGNPTQLLGTLQADGKLFLINPKGIVVGQGAVIDTAAFMASTLDVSDADFLRGGALTFKGDSAAGVANYGEITAREGSVMLFAHTVKNAGQINATNGTVGLGAGTEVYLAAPDATGFVIKSNLPATTKKTGVDNAGVIAAAQAQLEAAGGSIYELAVNQSGVIRATGTATVNGRVLLTANGGTVGVSGQVSARNADGSGGNLLVGGDYHGANANVANAARTVVTSTGQLDASAATATAKAGRVIVWSDDATRFLGTLNATGADGGFAEVSGQHWLDFNPVAPVQLGTAGSLLLDPDALVISADADAGTSTSGTNPFTFGATTEPATLNVTTLQNQLAATNVILDTSTSTGDITFNAAVTWATNNALTVRSGNNITINADITGGAASTLALYTARTADRPPETDLPPIEGQVTLDSNATITVGTLTYGTNEASDPGPDYTLDTPLQTGTAFLNGNLNVNTLNVDLSGGGASVYADGANNAIGAFTTTGIGTLRGAYILDQQGGLDVSLNSATAGGPYLQFITPGTLTLKSGSSLNFASTGTVVLASTGGAVVNEAGPDVFGANARFLIYTNTTAATLKNGLTGTEVFNHPYNENDYYDDTVSRFFFSAPSGSPILTYTADSFARTYGAANPALTFTRSGLIGGVTDDVTGAPTLAATATQSSGAGAYAINISAGTLASSNYDFGFVPGTLTIDRAPLTITANDQTRRINLANPDFDATFSGFVLGETSSALAGTLAFATPATLSSPAGTYAITPSGLTSANYAISFVPGTLTLTQITALLISADDFSRTYGAANPTFTASYTGFVNGETSSVVSGLQFNTAATQTSGIGTYTITPFGATAAGYDISYASGTLTINRAPLTISVPNQARTYGDANNLFANFNGLVNGESSSVVSGLSLTTAATPSSDVGTYAITAAGATADNYSITYSQGTLSVLTAPLTVSIANATRSYGDADPAFSYQVSGLKNNDLAANVVSVTGLASLASADAGIGSYGIIGFSSVISPNYSVTTQAGDLTITPRPLTITADNQSRVYGDANPTLTATFSGLASFDTPALFGNLGLTTQATPSSGVGDWGITFPTVTNRNYTITPQYGTLAITPAPLTLLPLIELTRVYGHANPDLTPPAVSGLKLTDTSANLGLAFTTPALTADVGTYSYELTTNNSNYTLPSATGEFRVAPAPLTVGITPTGRRYGDANPTSYEITAHGLAFSDTAAAVIGVSNPTELTTDIGTYAVSPLLLNHNYVIDSFTGGGFVISPRVLTFTAADRTKVYGEVNPSFFGSITGFADGDSELNIVKNYGFVTLAGPSSDVGSYAIRPTAQTTTPNYIATFVDGTLSVTPAPLTVTIANATRNYGQANPVFAVASAQGLKNHDALTSLDLTLFSTATAASHTGFYPILGSSAAPNYTVTFAQGTLTVERAEATIAVGTANRPFGDLLTAANPFALTFTGFLPADEPLAQSNWKVEFNDDASFAPGGHPVPAAATNAATTAALSENYNISVLLGSLNVTPRPVTITAADHSVAFGTKIPDSFAELTPAVPAGSPAFSVIGHPDTSGGAAGHFIVVPSVVPAAGVTQETLDRYFTFDLKPGALSIDLPKDNVDLTQQIDPSRLNTTNNTIINRTNTIDPATVNVEHDTKLTIAAQTEVAFDTAPLTKTDFANYFATFSGQADAVKQAMADSYSDLLKGKGQKDSSYEAMTANARQMLADWMSGALSVDDLRSRVASGDADAATAFGFILPALVNLSRAKDVADMTPMDRQVLGRLADLTEQRRSDTIKIAQEKYADMVKTNAERAKLAGLSTLFIGPGDFKSIVEGASQDAMARYMGATLGAGAGTGAGAAVLLSVPAIATAIFPHAGTLVVSTSAVGETVGTFTSSAGASMGASAAGPAVAIAMAVVLAVRAVQIGDSVKNEQDYNNLIKSWPPGEQITSIADLKSSAMDQDMKLSTLMLSADLLKSTP
ncbi:filamentous hemagglutinin N-terminal domain-containing protein [Horticoccus luteus]|uniref:Filamentous hemagglutinin N-terminal domain-containing protein n=1 Tax=Horticoccus luteus TaxID=2862869 RepID=A0A8F9TVZ9_9BACT|nr:MBG domain-containing protein [Horticoccus luteus]QYM79145.1 filamentous hemagglutinin N-terminal domain-containing protein [Horticoccus luteus]